LVELNKNPVSVQQTKKVAKSRSVVEMITTELSHRELSL